MSINAPCTCTKMFQTGTTKQTETRCHTQVFSCVKVEGESSGKNTSNANASGPQVFMIFAALTVAGVLTKNDVKSDTFFDTSLKHHEGYTTGLQYFGALRKY